MRRILGRQLAAAASGQGAAELGDLPEWNLADLYSGMEAPELKRMLTGLQCDMAIASVGGRGIAGDEYTRRSGRT